MTDETIEKAGMVFKGQGLISPSNIEFLSNVTAESMEDPAIRDPLVSLYEAVGGRTFKTAATLLGSQIKSVEDFVRLWDEQDREMIHDVPVSTQCSLLNNIEFLLIDHINKNKYSFNDAEFHIKHRLQYDFNLLIDRGYDEKIAQFVKEHGDFFTEERLSRIGRLPQSEIKRNN